MGAVQGAQITTGTLVSYGLMWLLAIGLISYWAMASRAHRRRIDQLDLRIHVNGIRGKSTVARLAGAVLREGGYQTLSKTTGSAARVIGPLGEETAITRNGAATINEQIEVAKEHVTSEAEALVVECMAVRPLYQEYAQDHMVRSDITIITNVRLDHQEEMGESLPEIADSMALTTPRGGVLITSEDRPALRERLAERAAERGSQFIYADPATVTDEDMAGFDYLQFKENVAIGLAIADLAAVRREAAIRGMWKSVPDVGVVRMRHYDIRGKNVLWVPMFAANDRESVTLTLRMLSERWPQDATVIAVLNNRADRGRRAELFSEMAATDLRQFIDQYVLFGAFEENVFRQITGGGVPAETVHRLGDATRPGLQELLDRIAGMIPGQEGVLLGMVNIHTQQAEMLMGYFGEEAGEEAVDELAMSLEPGRQPAGLERLRQAAGRRVIGAE